MSIKVAQNDSTRKMKDFDIFLQKLPINIGNLGKIIITTGFEKLPNLVTLTKMLVKLTR